MERIHKQIRATIAAAVGENPPRVAAPGQDARTASVHGAAGLQGRGPSLAPAASADDQDRLPERESPTVEARFTGLEDRLK